MILVWRICADCGRRFSQWWREGVHLDQHCSDCHYDVSATLE